MSERGFSMQRDGAGILVFTVGAFFAVLLLKALASDLPAGQATGTAALAQVWIDAIGWSASFLFTAGVAAIGARLFLTDTAARTAPAAGLLAIAAVAVAILFGSFSATAGGRVGDAIGGNIGRLLHPAVGALVGLALLVLPFAGMLRRRIETAEALALGPQREEPDGADGVTAAEAAALLPDDPPRSTPDARKQPRTSTWSPPTSPYPEDVRRRGEIPAGAKPLEPAHVATKHPAESPTVYRWTSARVEEPADTAGEDLAAVRDDDVVEPPRASAPIDRELEPDVDDVVAELAIDEPATETHAVVELEDDAATPVLGVASSEPELSIDDAEIEVAPALPGGAQPLASVPAPSWEQPSLFVEEEEPVDAYGTPMSLVEAIREEEIVEAQPSAAAVVQEAEEEEEEEEEEELEDDEDELDEVDEVDDEEADADEYEDDVEGELDDSDADEEASEEWEEDEEYDEEVVAEEDSDAESEPEEEPVTHAGAPMEAASETLAAGLADVVLTPLATADADRRKLLSDAGCLFVDSGRVAVSMLQRQYKMDFDAACKVLDELQTMGLIGPYLGGQRRDILLTREQWLEKVESA